MKKSMQLLLVLGMFSISMAAVDVPCVEAFSGQDDSWTWSGPKTGSYLGVRTQDVTKERVGALKLRDESGVEITAVDQDAPAAKAGFREHDVILTLNGQKVEGEQQLRRMVREIPSGRTVNIGISRDGQLLNLRATLADRKQMAMSTHRGDDTNLAIAPPIPPMPPMDMDIPDVQISWQAARVGAVVEGLTPQLAEFFGVKGGGGVLVRSVEKGSSAATAGFKAGDVIVRVDKERISDLSDWHRALRSHSGNLSISILRDKREQTLQLKVPERKKSEFRGLDFDENMESFRQEIQKLGPELKRNQQLIAKEIAAHRDEIQKAAEQARAAAENAREEVRKAQDNLKNNLEDLKLGEE